LSALLFFFAFLLLREQSQKKNSDIKVLREIRIYMFISVLMDLGSLVSSMFCATEEENRDIATIYKVDGTVTKEDGKSPADIMIIRDFPVRRVAPNGKILGYEIRRNLDGDLPTLTFQAQTPGYYIEPVNLRDYEDKIQGHTINIGQKVLRLATKGGQ
jgi:hypothetical protein